MRTTAVLLLVAVVGSTVQAVRIRGSRRKFIVDKPIVNLTPAQKEYFVRLLWLMKNFKNGSDPNLGPNNPELMQKLAQGGFYYDDGLNEKSKNGSSTKHSVYYYNGSQSEKNQNNLESGNTSNHVRSKGGDENSLNNGNHAESQNDNNNDIGDKISSNENVIPNPSPLESQEHIENLKHNDLLGPNVIDGNKSNSQSKSNETESPYRIESNTYFKESDIKIHHVVQGHESNDPLRNNEIQGDTVRSGEYDSYSKENAIKNESNKHVNNNAFRSNEILNGGEHKSYYRENDIKGYENNENSREGGLRSKSREIQWPYGSRSEEDSNYSSDDFPEVLLRSDEYYDLTDSLNQRSNEQKSSEERSPSYNGFDHNVQEPESAPDNHNTFYDNDNQSNDIGESIEDVLNENNKYQHRHKQESKYKHRYEYRQRHRQKLKISHLPRFIVKPDLSLETRIIPAPRLTSLVIKMCDISKPKILEVWKKVAKRLSLDSDYTISNINEVEQLFKIIRTFITLSKKENFLRMPLNKILVAIRDSISNERDSRSVEANKYEDYDDRYNSEERYYPENGLREPLDSNDFYVEASLKPVQMPSDSLSTFFEYIFKTQEDSSADSGHDDNSKSLISDESDAEKRQEVVNKDNSAEFLPNISSSDDVSNDRSVPNDLDADLINSRDYEDAASKIRDPQDELNQSKSSGDLDSDDSSEDVLPVLPSLEISSSRSSEQLPLIIPEGNSNINGSNQSIPEDDNLDTVIPSLEDNNEENTSDSLNSDDENGDIRPYSPNSDFSSESSNINDSIEHSTLPYPDSSTEHEREPEENLSVDNSFYISSPSSYPVTTEESISSDQKEPISSEDASNDLNNNLIPNIIEEQVNIFILTFLEKYGQCRGSIHDELSQKVREVIELLQNAKCF